MFVWQVPSFFGTWSFCFTNLWLGIRNPDHWFVNIYLLKCIFASRGQIKWVDWVQWQEKGVGGRGSSTEEDKTSAHRPEGGRGNGTAAEDWRHQRKRLSFRAWNKDRTQTLPALFHFNPSTLATSLLTLNYYLRSAVWNFLPIRAQRASRKDVCKSSLEHFIVFFKNVFSVTSEYVFGIKWWKRS